MSDTTPDQRETFVRIPEVAYTFGRYDADGFHLAWFPDLEKKDDGSKVCVVFSTFEEAKRYHEALTLLLSVLKTTPGPATWPQDFPVARLTRHQVLDLLRTALLKGVPDLLFDPGLPTSARAPILYVLAENG